MKRHSSLTLVMLPQQKAALEKIARFEGECVSVTLRRLIVNAAKERGLWPNASNQAQMAKEG